MGPSLLKAGCLALLVFCYSDTSKAQGLAADSIYHASIEKAVDVYHRFIFPQNHLYNGIAYLNANIRFVEGHPYFISTQPAAGSILYEGIRYKNVQLLYNILLEQLIILHPVNYLKIVLSAEKVDRFSILDHQFVHIRKDALKKEQPTPGFYQVLYESPGLQLLKKSGKTIREELSTSEGVLYHLKESRAYYIKKNDQFHLVSNRKKLLKAFQDKKKSLQLFMKTNKIPKGIDKDAVLTSIVAYYDKNQ